MQDTILKITAIVVALVVVIGVKLNVDKWRNDMETKRMEVICPSFLSIARSARDTLIVMRNEPLCNRYVLDNLR